MTDQELRALARPMAEELIDKDDNETLRRLRRVVTGGGRIDARRISGRIQPGNQPIVYDESIVVAIASLPTIQTQEQFNEFVVAGLGTLAGAAFDPDTILTAGGEVLVGASGNVLVSG